MYIRGESHTVLGAIE
ncbi:hypothetical protein [Peribacillus butanolivorans]